MCPEGFEVSPGDYPPSKEGDKKNHPLLLRLMRENVETQVDIAFEFS